MTKKLHIYKYLVILLVSLVFISSMSTISYSQQVDPSPLIILYLDVLDNLINDEYGKAYSLINAALNVSLPPEYIYIHKSTYESLYELTKLFEEIENIYSTGVETSRAQYIKNLYLKLYSLSLDIIDKLHKYFDYFAPLFKDPDLLNYMRLRLEYKLLLLDEKITRDLSLLEEILGNIHKCCVNYLGIKIGMPSHIFAGRSFNLEITPYALFKASSASNANVSLKIIIIYGGLEYEVINKSIQLNRTIRIRIITPTINDLEKKYLKLYIYSPSRYYMPMKIIITAHSRLGDKVFYGIKTVYGRLLFSKPNVIFNLPSYAYRGEKLVVKAYSTAKTHIRIHVYLDKISNKTFLGSYVLKYGWNILEFSTRNISKGYHTLLILSDATGSYVETRWTVALAIVERLPEITVTYQKIFLYTPAVIDIKSISKERINYEIKVWINNELVFNKITNKTIEVTYPIPLNILVQSYLLRINITPVNGKYSSLILEDRIYAINIPLLILLAIIISSIIAYSDQEFTRLMFLIKRIHGYPGRGHIKHKLVQIYYWLITLLEDFYGIKKPYEWETLREYLARIEGISVDKYTIIRDFIINHYEKYLYANQYFWKNIINTLKKKLRVLWRR